MMEGPQDDVDLYAGPLNDRLVHKNWKVRVAAYKELTSTFKEATNDKPFKEYGGVFKKIVVDKNAAAQETGLEALISWIERSEHPTKLIPVCSLLVPRSFSGRPKSKTLAREALLLFIEVDNSGDAVVASLLEHTGAKQWKVAMESILCIKEALCAFGSRVVSVKPILKAIPALFDNSNAKVRNAATMLAAEVHRWIGDAAKASIESLRPAQKNAIAAAVEKLPSGKPKPTRLLRSEQDRVASHDDEASDKQGGYQGEEEEEEDEPTQMDAFDLAEPADVISALPENYATLISSSKWKERKEALEAFLKLADKPRLKEDNYNAYVKGFRQIISKDANVMVVAHAAKCIGALARGLRGEFSTLAKTCLPTMLEKFKEKKCSVTTALHDALAGMMGHCFSILDVLEEIKGGVDSKVPKTREQTFKFVAAFVPVSTRALLTKAAKKGLLVMVVGGLGDSDPSVREAAYQALGVSHGALGEKFMSPYLAKLDKVKTKKVAEYFPSEPLRLPGDRSTANKRKRTPKPPAAAAAGAAKRTSGPSKSSSSRGPSSSSRRSTKPSSPFLHTTEEALELGNALVPEETRANLRAKNWKLRMQALGNVAGLVNPEMDRSSCEVLVRVVEAAPGFSSNNFQVQKGAIGVVQRLAEQCCWFTPALAGVVLTEGFIGKLADFKLQRAVEGCLDALAQAVGLWPVLEQLVAGSAPSAAGKTPSPKVLKAAMDWAWGAWEEYGLESGPGTVNGLEERARVLAQWCLCGVNHADKQVRSVGARAMARLFPYANDVVQEIAQQVANASVLSQLQGDFEKRRETAPPAPCKVARPSSATTTTTASPRGKTTEAPSRVPSSSARLDVSSLATEMAVELRHEDWKRRKAALSRLYQVLCDAKGSGGIGLQGIEILLKGLKPRLQDRNANLIVLALQVLEALGGALSGAGSLEKWAKNMVPPVLACFADGKKHVRDACATTLDSWDATGAMPASRVMPYVAAPLGADGSTGRTCVLTWALRHREALGCAGDLRPMVKPLLACVQDRMHQVRHLAEELLLEVGRSVGYEAVRKYALALRAAQRNQIAPVMTRLKEALASSTSPTNTAAAAPTMDAPASLGPPQRVAAPTNTNHKSTSVPPPTKLPGTSTTGAHRHMPRPDMVRKPPSSSSSSSSREDSALLLPNRKRKARAQQDTRDIGGWTVVETPEPLWEYLRDQMCGCVAPSLLSNLFHADFAHQAHGLYTLQRAVQSQGHEARRALKDNADLVLKWLSFRLFDTSAASLRNTLDTIRLMVAALEQEGHTLGPYEGGVILPALCRRLSYSETTLEGCRALFVILPRVLPCSMVLHALHHECVHQAGQSRTTSRINTHVQECLREMAGLLNRHGLMCLRSLPRDGVPSEWSEAAGHGPSAVLEHVVRLALDKDRPEQVRACALGVLREACCRVGYQRVWSHVGDNVASPTTLHDLEIRMETGEGAQLSGATSAPPSPRGDAPPPPPMMDAIASSPTTTTNDTDTDTDDVAPSVDGTPTKLPSVLPPPGSASKYTTPKSVHAASRRRQSRVAPPSALKLPDGESTTTTLHMEEPSPPSDSKGQQAHPLVDHLGGADSEGAVEAIKALSENLKHRGGQALLPIAGSLVDALSNQLVRAFEHAHEARLRKYVCNFLCEAMGHEKLAGMVDYHPLRNVLLRVLALMVAPETGALPAEEGLQPLLQRAATKIIQNSDRTAAFTSLLWCLETCVHAPESWMAPTLPQLVCRSILAYNKYLKQNIDDVNVDQMLLDIHNYLEAHPRVPEVVQDRKSPENLAYRVVASMVTELVGLKGRDVANHLSLVPVTKYPTPKLVRYLNTALQKKFGGDIEVLKLAQLHEVPAHVDTLSALADIFKALSAPHTREEGVRRLHLYRRDHPEVDVSKYLDKCSAHLQAYIRRGLLALDQANSAPQDATPQQHEASTNGVAHMAAGKADLTMEKENEGQTTSPTHHADVTTSEVHVDDGDDDDGGQDARAGATQRLEDFKSKYLRNSGSGAKHVRDGAAPALSSASQARLNSLRARLARKDSHGASAPVSSASKSDESAPSTSIADLRARLMKIKSGDA